MAASGRVAIPYMAAPAAPAPQAESLHPEYVGIIEAHPISVRVRVRVMLGLQRLIQPNPNPNWMLGLQRLMRNSKP